LRPKLDAMKDRFDRIPAGATRTKAIGMRGQLGFPGGFQGLAHEGLACPVGLGGNSERALFRAPPFRNPGASQWRSLAIDTECGGQAPPLGWGERLSPVNAHGVFTAVM